MLPQTHECAHQPCTCQIPLDHSFCSDHCSTQAALGQQDGECECEHAGCLPPPAELDEERRSAA